MSGKDSFKKVKKSKLFYRRDRKKAHHEFEESFKQILNGIHFHFLDHEAIQATKIDIESGGIANMAHRNFSKEKCLEIDQGDELDWPSIVSMIDNTSTKWIFVFPTNWYLVGGLLIETCNFNSKFDQLSYLMDDDFDLYGQDFESHIKFQGDRLSDKIS